MKKQKIKFKHSCGARPKVHNEAWQKLVVQSKNYRDRDKNCQIYIPTPKNNET